MPSSITSSKSTCTNPENETLSEVLENDRIRYVRKGYGLITAIVLISAFFFLLPLLLKPFYQDYVSLWGSPAVAMAFGTMILDLVTFWVLNLGMYIVYHIQHPFFEKYKINMNPWPWNADREEWKLMLKRTLLTIVLNQFILLPFFAYAEALITGVPLTFEDQAFPDPLTLILQVTFFMLMEDMTFYFGHRLLHNKRIYRFIHKQHHEYNTTVGLASFYAHPVEFVLVNMFPATIGPKLLWGKCHIVTFWMWIILRTAETVDGHCGYDFSWSPYRLLPLSGGSQYHDFHHSHNVGNYGSFFSLWDTVFGTNSIYFKYLALREQQKDVETTKAEIDAEYQSGSVEERAKVE
jgi:sterol desaturase/sphingolipid hydroxylase (fatty acid hydroxylase superfamily)